MQITPTSAATLTGKSSLRWLIAFALFLAAVLNYIDRSVLGLLAPTIQKDLAISDQSYATVINFFLAGYTIAYLLSGRIVDKIGVRLSMSLFIAWWSVSNALTGLARSARSLSIFRFMLGLGEAGGFTASPKAVSEWFPSSERAIAIGMYSMGGALGATLAPFIVGYIAPRYGWRWVFAISPVLGSIWLLLWWRIYKPPVLQTTPPPPPQPENNVTATDFESGDAAIAQETQISSWTEILRTPIIWQFMLVRLLTDPVWYFYQFWMPKYLFTVRGLDQKGLSKMWMIFLAADAGFLLGGFLSGMLIKRGLLASASRLRIMLVSACMVPLSVFIPNVHTVGCVFALGMVIAYACTAWLGNLTSLIVDLLPRRILGTAFGVVACGSALGAIFMNQVVAWLIHHRSYTDCFYIMAVLHPIALVLIWRLRKRQTV